jgi:hypothetical protein
LIETKKVKTRWTTKEDEKDEGPEGTLEVARLSGISVFISGIYSGA